MAGLKTVDNTILKQLQSMMDRAKMAQGYLDRVVYKQYQNRQRKRFITQGNSEGTEWPSLNPKYAQQKLKRFASFPGGGRKMMIATGRLQQAVIGPGGEHRKVSTNSRLIVSWTTPYAVYTEDVRPVNVWDEKQTKQMYEDFASYMMKGVVRSVLGGG